MFTLQATNKDVITVQTTKGMCIFFVTLFCCFCLLVTLLVAVLSVLCFMYYTGYPHSQQQSGLQDDALSLMRHRNATELQDKDKYNTFSAAAKMSKTKKTNTAVKSGKANKTDKVKPDKSPLPITFILSNFTKKMKNREKWYSNPFITYEGYQTCLRIDAGGHGDGRGTHISVFLKVMKDSNDSLHFLRNGYFVIELISQAMIAPHKLRIVVPYNASCRTSGNKVTKGTGTTYWLGFTDFVSIESARTYYLRDDKLHFRVTYSEYFWYIDAVLLHVPDIPVIVLSAVVSSVMIYWVLMSVEYAAFCTGGSSALLPSCNDFTVGKIKQFVLTKQDVLLHTWYVTVYSTTWEFIKYALTIVMEVVSIAAGELIYWDMPTASDNVVPTLMIVRRVTIVIVFSMVVNQYVMSQGGRITIVHPLWLIKAYSYAVADY